MPWYTFRLGRKGLEGIKDVCVVDKDEWRLQKARQIGALTVNPTDENLPEGLIKHFGAVNVYGMTVPDVDVFVDAAGAPVFQTFFELECDPYTDGGG